MHSPRYYLRELADGESGLVDTTYAHTISFRTRTGATLTYSRVNTKEATGHDGSGTDVAAGSFETLDVDWPFYWVSVSGGGADVAWV